LGLELVQTPIRTEFQASEVTITAKDSATGETLVRTLPVTFKENHFGIWLEGEDELGNTQALVVFTATGRRRLEDLLGVDKSEEVIEQWTQNSSSAI
jgi:hypothetical protein